MILPRKAAERISRGSGSALEYEMKAAVGEYLPKGRST